MYPPVPSCPESASLSPFFLLCSSLISHSVGVWMIFSTNSSKAIWTPSRVLAEDSMNIICQRKINEHIRPLKLKNDTKWTTYFKNSLMNLRSNKSGSGCGAVGRAVAYDTRGPWFESSHWQLLLNIYLLLTVCRKDENKEKRPGMAHFF